MQYRNWGQGCPRWDGIRSETSDLDGQRVHLLRAAPGQDAHPDALAQLLLHGLAGSGTTWATARLASAAQRCLLP